MKQAALRVARFHTNNDFSDWNLAHHPFTFANAVHQGLRRVPTLELLRGVFDAAMSVYLMTKAIIKLGWQPPELPTEYDILPLMIEDLGIEPKMYHWNRDEILEVEIEHPTISEFILNLVNKNQFVNPVEEVEDSDFSR